MPVSDSQMALSLLSPLQKLVCAEGGPAVWMKAWISVFGPNFKFFGSGTRRKLKQKVN